MQATVTRRTPRTQGPRPYRFTAAQFHQMDAAGLLPRDQRVELLDGQLMLMMSIGPRHAGLTTYLQVLFSSHLGEQALVRVQNPIHLDAYSEPQPDLAVLKPQADFYMAHHPTPAEVLLVVEVSDSTLREDRRLKVPHYARAGIVEVWLVAPQQHYVEVYRRPEGGRYAEVMQYRVGSVLAPLQFPETAFPVQELLGPPPG